MNNGNLDIGSLMAGLLFTGLGIAFVLEASGQWSFEFGHFRFIGPLVLIVIGITTLVGATMARHHDGSL
ncbi:MAG: hypothetical protein OEW83_15970 [Acidimicrobiia bacterium]|nr:hypothetical protein [Acidimicrobiia bacterium]